MAEAEEVLQRGGQAEKEQQREGKSGVKQSGWQRSRCAPGGEAEEGEGAVEEGEGRRLKLDNRSKQ